MFSNINIVLLNTSHPGNIGSTARAMKTMGLNNLKLVNPKEFPSDQATARAVGCSDILEQSEIFDNLSSAISSSEVTIGLSARKRKANIPILHIDECIKLMLNEDIHEYNILFGNEKSGLSNDELLVCDYIVSLPTDSAYQSLNLSAAVQLFVYELFKNSSASSAIPQKSSILASNNEKDFFYSELFKLLRTTKFISPKNKKSLTKRIHILFNKAKLEKEEVNILMGMINSINKKLKNS